MAVMIHFLPQNNAHKVSNPFIAVAFQLLWKLGGILEFDTYIVSSDTQATNQGQVS